MPPIAPRKCRSPRVVALLLVALTTLISYSHAQESSSGTTNAAGVSVRWRAHPGVPRYRLQISLDNAFSDIVLDRAVFDNTYRITELPPGKYYWRVAPAATETGEYSTIGVFVITSAAPPETTIPTSTAERYAISESKTAVEPSASANRISSAKRLRATIKPPINAGWRTATNGANAFDVSDFSPPVVIVGESDGSVSALDAWRGTVLWTARLDSRRRSGSEDVRERVTAFDPLCVAINNMKSSRNRAARWNGVLVRADGGVRMLDLASGRGMWRASLDGEPLSAAFAGEGAASVSIVATKNPDQLYFIDNRTGRVVRRERLDGNVIGAPVVMKDSVRTEVVVALGNNTLAIFDLTRASTVRFVRLDAALTTAPLRVEDASGARLLVGTERGLIALRLPDLQAVWRVATHGEAPRGRLAGADLEGDGRMEAAMITGTGRVALVDAERGEIKWIGARAADAAHAAFADLDRDGTLDVIVAPDRDTFAIAYSGRDGRFIWSAGDMATSVEEVDTARPTNGEGSLRRLVVAALRDERGEVVGALLVGIDPTGAGLRAVPISRSTLRNTSR